MRILHKSADELAFHSCRIEHEADGKLVLRLLEAGCGRQWHLGPGELPIAITDVAACAVALASRGKIDDRYVDLTFVVRKEPA